MLTAGLALARRQRLLFTAAIATAALIRFLLCLEPNGECNDTLRHVGYGRAFWEHGLRVYDLCPPEIASAQGWGSLWPTHTYDYPVVALLFFAVLAKLSTGVMVAKFVLTALEAVNAVLVGRLTGSKWLGVAYFSSPLSLYWVSHEGQFEPVAAFLMLLAVDALRRGSHGLAWLALSLAVQAKLLPVLLVPVFLLHACSVRGLFAFAVGFLPSVMALARSRYIGRMLDHGYWASGYNPFDWRIWSTDPFHWIPAPLISWNAILSYGMLGLASYFALTALAAGNRRGALGYVPLILFLIVLKSMSWCQFWYLVMAPAFTMTIEDPGPRRLLMLLVLFEGRAATALWFGPYGMLPGFKVDDYMLGGA